MIRTPDRRLRVFVSSTLGELAEKRRAVSRAVLALRLTPVMFEAGARPYPPAQVYRAYLGQADVFIGVYWQRYGQLVPGMEASGLEEEFELSGGEACDLAERTGVDWPAAGPQAQLGILAVLRGSLDEARRLLEEALDLSLAVRNTAFVTLCLSAYAWLAFADGDTEQAARLEGAAEGLRGRVGLRAWPILRPVEADLVARLRQRLGEDRFDQAFSAGSRLSQRQAIGVVRDQPRTEAP